MGIKAHFLKDNNGNKFYPYAHASAVFDSNGQKVEKRLNDLDTNKIDKQDGKSLSSNDYTDEEKNKLASIQSNAEQNVQSDWNEIDSTSDAYIKNKPTSLPSNGGNSDTVNGHTVNSDVPANAKFTDTIYDDTEIKNSITELNSNKLDKTTVATSSTLGLVKSGTDITVDTSGNVSVNDNSHKHTVSNISDLTATASELNVLDGITATTQELNYVDGVTSNIQTQLNSKSANGHTHDDRYYTESEVDITVSNINNSISSHTSNTSNPHSVTKAQVGLGNVENKSSATIRGEITKSNVTTALGYTPLNQSLKGSASGLAELDSNGKVPSSQLPSFVDDVVEGYLSGGKFYKESAHTTEISGETGKIYIDLSTEKTYRWSGSAFVVISETLALGETSSTAYRGDRGKTAYDHSQSTHARTDATKVEKSSINGNIKINGTETTVYTHPSGTNPHGTTKSDVGLGNVGNFKAVSTVSNQGLTDAEKANARANIGAGTSSFSGSYNDLSNKPTIPTNNNQLTNGAGYITSSGTAKTISDTLPLSKGGTGQTTGINAANALINSLSTGESTPTDADYYISQYVGGGTTTTTYHRRPMSALWNYIKSKLATVATSGSYNDLSNKPTIPSVGNGTVTIKQAGTSKGTFTMNQTGNTTIELTDNNTTYGVATQSANGLESAADKKKLDGIATGAEVNQNAFSNVVVGSTTISADSKTDSLTLAGSNVTITPDADNDKVTIGITKANVTSALGYTPPTTNTTYSDMTGATTDANGTHGLVPAPTKGAANRYLRSDGTWSVPPDNNTVYTHPTTSGNKHIPSGGSSGQILRWSADGTAVWGADNNTTYSDMKGATSSAAGTHGLVPAPASGKQSSFLRGDGTWAVPTDTNTWRGIQNNLTSDSTTDSLSAAQGKVLKRLVDGKANASHGTHVPSVCTTITDWNSATSNGWYMASNASNQPVSNGGWFYGVAIVHNSNYIRQIAWHFATDNSVSGTNCDKYERVKNNGTWGSWVNTSVRVAVPSNAKFTDTNTTNTTGSTNTSSKIFLVGATSQAASPQTYSHDTVYVGTDGCLYSNSTRVVNEVISSSEPSGQINNDYWLCDY